jgi:hypothetical protein
MISAPCVPASSRTSSINSGTTGYAASVADSSFVSSLSGVAKHRVPYRAFCVGSLKAEVRGSNPLGAPASSDKIKTDRCDQAIPSRPQEWQTATASQTVPASTYGNFGCACNGSVSSRNQAVSHRGLLLRSSLP